VGLMGGQEEQLWLGRSDGWAEGAAVVRWV
jgi:hypothetical protein